MRRTLLNMNYVGTFLLVGFILFLFVKYFKKQTLDTTLQHVVSVLYRQCARWAVAAEQDENVVIRVLHANYATGYLWAIKDIVTTDVFQKITGEEFLGFEKKVVQIQDHATKELVTMCKEAIPISDPTLLKAIYETDNS